MRLSCNGCRVLRKGCSDACTIRPCLQWIKAPDAQANATVFLAKFYGRAGLLNLLSAAGTADHNLRPAVFRSLLYEACGRIVNPTYGAVGLLWSGKWNMCQAAVEAVLNGQPIVVVHSSDGAGELGERLTLHNQQPPAVPAAASSYDIRHVFPKSVSMSSNKPPPAVDAAAQDKGSNLKKRRASSSPPPPFKTRRKTTTTHQNNINHAAAPAASPATHDDDDMVVVEVAVDRYQQQQEHAASSDYYDDHHHSLDTDTDSTGAASHVSQADQTPAAVEEEEQQQEAEQQPPPLGLDLTLGLLLGSRPPPPAADEPGAIGFRLFL